MKFYDFIKLIKFVVKLLTHKSCLLQNNPSYCNLLLSNIFVNNFLAFCSFFSNNIPSIKIKYWLLHFIKVYDFFLWLIVLYSWFNQICLKMNLSKFIIRCMIPSISDIFCNYGSLVWGWLRPILFFKFRHNFVFIFVIYDDWRLL